jgi:hypothetical protein
MLPMAHYGSVDLGLNGKRESWDADLDSGWSRLLAQERVLFWMVSAASAAAGGVKVAIQMDLDPVESIARSERILVTCRANVLLVSPAGHSQHG